MRAIFRDITRLPVDAIVNAANPWLLGGGGVDGTIHEAAGPELLEACRALNGCERGQAKLTPGFRLPARFVIHAVGPVWNGGSAGEATILASCYTVSLGLARSHGVKSIAFPSISTGVYGYPIELAAEVAVSTCRKFLEDRSNSMDITFCCFSHSDLAVYERVLSLGASHTK
jgi:O-acetyl-ADP-ribose deacetylase